MDYKKIYDQFISNRRCHKLKRGGGNERHHIVPKCMGGNDRKDNLIYLTYEDHFFAHLLLAKAYDGTEHSVNMWFTIQKMTGETELRKITPRMRKLFSIAKMKVINTTTGLNNPTTRKEIFDFIHKNGTQRTYTMNELCNEFNLEVKNMYKVCFEKSRKTCIGWTTKEIYNSSNFFWDRTPEKGMGNNKNSDKTIRKWKHKNGEEFEGTTLQFATKLNDKNASHYSDIVKGKHAKRNGWYLPEQYPEFPSNGYLRKKLDK